MIISFLLIALSYTDLFIALSSTDILINLSSADLLAALSFIDVIVLDVTFLPRDNPTMLPLSANNNNSKGFLDKDKDIKGTLVVFVIYVFTLI